jgi:hypothetical protein
MNTPAVTMVAAWIRAETGGRALHGVRQPGVEQELRRLAHGAHEEQQAGDGQRVPLDPEELEAGIRQLRAPGKIWSKVTPLNRTNRVKMPEKEAEIADPVDDEGLHGRRVGGFLVVPEADEQVAREAHALPAEEHLDQVVGGHQHEHGEGEERQIGEEAGPVRVLVHVADGIEVHEGRHAVHDHEHHDRERVDPERPIDDHVAGGEPLGDLHPRRPGP